MKQTIRSFALGLLVAGVIILATFYFTADKRDASQKLSTDEMIASIEDEGYHVLNESEYISVSVNSDNSENKTKEKEQNKSTQKNKDTDKQNKKNDDNSNNDKSDSDNKSEDSSKEGSDKKDTVSYTLKIKSGMAPSVISNKLAENDIINNADKFTRYMENHDYTKKVQLGKFKFNSDMSHYEIAEKLTN
ncbi:hypothetical protein GCM10009001_19180 [Virgibacillus siamensis]|uniref:YceG-like family protein n=1 Tax=Virgibacillus siamensis TaxID=480071 RepID=A0ABP3R4H4_9BACI